MNAKSKSSRGYAVYEDDPLSCQEYSLSLEAAFYSILAHCRYEAVWDTEETQMALRFRYTEGGAAGRFVGDTEPGPDITTFTEPLHDEYGVAIPAFLVRNRLMSQVLSAGLRGWYGVPMDRFYVERSKAENARKSLLGIVR